MSTIEEQSKGRKEGEIRYLTPLNITTTSKKKYCRFKRSGIKYIDYKDPDFLINFVNEQGKLLPRRLTGTSLKYQRKVSKANQAHSYNALCWRHVKVFLWINIKTGYRIWDLRTK